MSNQLKPTTMPTDLVVVSISQLVQVITDVVSAEMQKMADAAPKPVTKKEYLPELITKKQAAKILQVSTGTVDNYTNRGILSKMKIGTRNVRFERCEVERLGFNAQASSPD